MQVLIVEAEATVANALASALKARGHQVSVAASTRDALSMPRPEVLIADPEMAGLTGLDLLETYQRAGQAPRTIFISATHSTKTCRRALQLGATEFLPKPFRLEELIKAVEEKRSPARPLLDCSYAATPSNLESCLRDVAAFALRHGVGPTCRARCCTALGELIENIIQHAYPFEVGEFAVIATVDERELVVTVSDYGVGGDLEQSLPDVVMNGGGLARAASLSEELDCVGGLGLGTTISMVFDTRRGDFGDDEITDLSEFDYLGPDMTREVMQTLRVAEGEEFLQLPPSLAVVIGRLLAGPDPRRIVAQALRS
jgi:CheY-like chemotaxis protein